MSGRFGSVGLNLAAAALGLAVLAATVGLTMLLAADVGDLLIRNTVRLSLTWYMAAVCSMLFMGPADWAIETPRGWAARWCWTWGLLCFLVHLAMAFHFFHHWSHAHAFERTRQVSGVGEGIYVSYLFTWLWGADVAYWWLSPAGYAARSRWIDRTLQAFMLFIVINGTIVFETGAIRWAGVAGLVLLAGVWWASRRSQKSRQVLPRGRSVGDWLRESVGFSIPPDAARCLPPFPPSGRTRRGALTKKGDSPTPRGAALGQSPVRPPFRAEFPAVGWPAIGAAVR